MTAAKITEPQPACFPVVGSAVNDDDTPGIGLHRHMQSQGPARKPVLSVAVLVHARANAESHEPYAADGGGDSGNDLAEVRRLGQPLGIGEVFQASTARIGAYRIAAHAPQWQDAPVNIGLPPGTVLPVCSLGP